MLILAYDTETTGLPIFKERSHHPDQPHLVELAFVVFDTELNRDVHAWSGLIQPGEWGVDPGAAKVHGYTTETLRAHAKIVEEDAVMTFFSVWEQCDSVLGHNEQFDARIMRIAGTRYKQELSGVFSDDLLDRWKDRDAICTQKLATPIVKAPATDKMKAAGRHGHKTASLSEAFEHVTGLPLQGAHSAMVDAQAALSVYLGLNHQEEIRKAATGAASNENDDDMPGFL